MVKGEITGEIWDLYDLKQQLAALDDDMELTINSPGGSVMEGLQVINLIQKCNKKIKAIVEVQSSSIAAVIALCCDSMEIKKTDFMVLHHCMTFAFGNKEALQEEIDAMTVIDNILHDHITAKCKDPDALVAQLNTGRDVWLTGEQVAQMFENVTLCEPKKKEGLQNCADITNLIRENQANTGMIASMKAELEALKAEKAEREDADRRMAIARRISSEVYTNV